MFLLSSIRRFGTVAAEKEQILRAKWVVRRRVIIASIGFGVLTAAPVFWYIGSIIFRPLPAVSQHLAGRWMSGDKNTIKFNRFGMISFESPDDFVKGSFTVEESDALNLQAPKFYIDPVLGLGERREFLVTKWPQGDNDTFIVNGMVFERVQ
jgi:hypothetical protein